MTKSECASPANPAALQCTGSQTHTQPVSNMQHGSTRGQLQCAVELQFGVHLVPNRVPLCCTRSSNRNIAVQNSGQVWYSLPVSPECEQCTATAFLCRWSKPEQCRGEIFWPFSQCPTEEFKGRSELCNMHLMVCILWLLQHSPHSPVF